MGYDLDELSIEDSEQDEQNEQLALARINMINKRFKGRINGKFEEKVSTKKTNISPKKKSEKNNTANGNDDNKIKSHNQKNQENFGERKRIKP